MTTEPQPPSEGKQLDDLSLDEAKAILCQLRWFDTDTIFMSLRFTEDDFAHVQEAVALKGRLSIESFISALCEQYVLDERSKSDDDRPE